METSNILPGIVSLFLLITLNAFFVLAEYSLAISRRTRIAELVEQGNTAARTVQQLMSEPDRFFATTQIGVTIMSIAIGIVSEPAFTELFHVLFALIGISVSWWGSVSYTLSAVLGLMVATYFQIVLAELVPRALAQHSAERIALKVAPPMNALSRMMTPFIWLLKTSSRAVVALLGVDTSDAERPHSVEELKMLVAASEKGGVIESEQREMLNAVFTFGDTTVREMMVPRTEIVCVDVDTPLQEVVHLLSSNPISRLPVYEGSLDHIVGILHSKDMIRAITPVMRGLDVRKLMREAFFVPDTQRADELLQQFRRRHEHMAIVLDEYGGTAGLVTLYDLVSEIVGEVGDATNETPPEIQRSPDGSAVINGLVSIGDVNEVFDLNLTDPNYDTIGGFVMGQLGRIPKLGDVVELKTAGVRFKVQEMDKLRVARVQLVRILPQSEGESPSPVQ
jgi:putative hemolysin